jgi:hypothetical protein
MNRICMPQWIPNLQVLLHANPSLQARSGSWMFKTVHKVAEGDAAWVKCLSVQRERRDEDGLRENAALHTARPGGLGRSTACNSGLRRNTQSALCHFSSSTVAPLRRIAEQIGLVF